MRQNKPLDLIKLNEYLLVDPDSPTGLRWKKKHWKMDAGAVAGGKKDTGHCTVAFFGARYHAHRIVWALSNNADPGELTVDHIDRNPSNNHPDNLRLASHSGQLFNTRARESAHGRNVKRVGNRYYARLNINGKDKCLGGYNTQEEAASVAHAAKTDYIATHKNVLYPTEA
jgi:hypothetical protein